MGLLVNMEKENTSKRDIQTHERDVVRVCVCVNENYLGSSFISAWVTIEYMNGRNGRSLQGVRKYIEKNIPFDRKLRQIIILTKG